MTATTQKIIVGYDGSPDSRAAARWGLDEAARTGAAVEFCDAERSPAAAMAGVAGAWFDDKDELAQQAMMSEATVRAARTHPGVTTHQVIAHARAALTWCERSADAGLVVLGSRGHNAAAGLLGSVSVTVSWPVRYSAPSASSSCTTAPAAWRSSTTVGCHEPQMPPRSPRGHHMRLLAAISTPAARPSPDDLSGRTGLKPLRDRLLREQGGVMTQILHKTDHELKTAVVDELEWTPSVNPDRIAVSVDNGAITLSGQVETYPEKDAATRAVMHVRGVTAVADEIEVKNGWAPREDSDIAREASDALDRMVYVPAGAVQAKVHNHVITLSGTLTWEYQRAAARDAMAVLRGVRGVVNTISLKPKATITPTAAKAKITAALVRKARFDGQHITVHVNGTEIELGGTVASWTEHRQAGYAAWAAPGVTDVKNQLLVSY